MTQPGPEAYEPAPTHHGHQPAQLPGHAGQAGGPADPRMNPLTVQVAGAGKINVRGSNYQDRWGTGSTHAGTWLAVADGIGGGPRGAEAAQVAINIANKVLSSGDLDEQAVYRVFDTAHAALWPWYEKTAAGGTTLTLAVITTSGILIAAVGDSPAYLDAGDGTGITQVTRPGDGKPLPDWLGKKSPPSPNVSLWPLPSPGAPGPNGVPGQAPPARVIITSDGIDPDITRMLTGSPASMIARALEPPAVNSDDATLVVALIHPLGAGADATEDAPQLRSHPAAQPAAETQVKGRPHAGPSSPQTDALSPDAGHGHDPVTDPLTSSAPPVRVYAARATGPTGHRAAEHRAEAPAATPSDGAGHDPRGSRPVDWDELGANDTREVPRLLDDVDTLDELHRTVTDQPAPIESIETAELAQPTEATELAEQPDTAPRRWLGRRHDH